MNWWEPFPPPYYTGEVISAAPDPFVLKLVACLLFLLGAAIWRLIRR